MDDGDLDAIRQRFAAASRGPVILLDPLPCKVRLRLWLTGRIDGAAIWLVEHQHFRAAIAIWRACGMW